VNDFVADVSIRFHAAEQADTTQLQDALMDLQNLTKAAQPKGNTHERAE
jgi:hypothetical protein